MFVFQPKHTKKCTSLASGFVELFDSGHVRMFAQLLRSRRLPTTIQGLFDGPQLLRWRGSIAFRREEDVISRFERAAIQATVG